MLKIAKLIRMAGEFAEEYSTSGMIDISCTLGVKSIQVTEEVFFKTFEEYTTERAKYRNDYPFTHFVFINDVKFFCATREEKRK